MVDEDRERIERMEAEGKISPDEAEKLKEAVDRSGQREDLQAPAASRAEGSAPRLSGLAIAGALGVPAAIAVTLLIHLLVDGFGGRPRGQLQLALFGAIAFAGWMLSGAAWSVIGANPERLRGKGVAVLGLLMPVLVALAFLMRMAPKSEPSVTPSQRLEIRENIRKLPHPSTMNTPATAPQPAATEMKPLPGQADLYDVVVTTDLVSPGKIGDEAQARPLLGKWTWKGNGESVEVEFKEGGECVIAVEAGGVTSTSDTWFDLAGSGSVIVASQRGGPKAVFAFEGGALTLQKAEGLDGPKVPVGLSRAGAEANGDR